MAYFEKLKDPRWQKKRLEILSRDNFTCNHCEETTKTLHVHHLSYSGKINPWDVDESCLITLCENCHEIEEEKIRIVKDLINTYCLVFETINPVYEILFEKLYGERPRNPMVLE